MLVSTEHIHDIRPTAEKVGKAFRIDDALGRYIVFCKNTFPDALTLDGLKLVLDCANGATYKVAPIIFRELGAEVIPIHCEPDGKNINHNCGSEHTADLEVRVRETGAHAGLAFDGDGDRLIVVDETGTTLTGDHMIGIAARELKRTSRLTRNLVIFTAMSNIGLRRAMTEMQIDYRESGVGDRNVLELMLETGAELGGEQSGHILFRNHHSTGDGIVSALQLLAIMIESGKTLSALASMIQLAPQRLLNLPVTHKPPIDELPGLADAIRAAEAELGDRGRILVRYSGTQQICRVMVEGPDAATTDRITEQLASVVRRAIG